MEIIKDYKRKNDLLQTVDRTVSNISCSQFGIDDFRFKKSIGWRTLKEYTISFVIRGKGKYYSNDKIYECKENDVFVTFPGIRFSLMPDDEDPWKYFWIVFNGKTAPTMISDALFNKKNLVYNIKYNKKIIKTINGLINYSKNRVMHFRLRTIATLLNIFAQITEERSTNITTKIQKSNGENYTHQAINYIQANYSNANLTVKEIANSLFISHSHLCRVFKFFSGMSIYHYLILYRLEQASLLLEYTNEKVVVIAKMVGYPNNSYFCDQFKSHYGYTPLKYREKIKEIKRNELATKLRNK